MATMKQLAVAVRKRWGKTASVRRNLHAPTEAQKEVIRATRAERRERIEAIDQELKQLGQPFAGLVAAAEFVCDVNGDPPSIDQLREKVEAHRRFSELRDDRDELKSFNRTNEMLHCHRYEVVVLKTPANLFAYNEQVCSADTAEELLAKITQKEKSNVG